MPTSTPFAFPTVPVYDSEAGDAGAYRTYEDDSYYSYDSGILILPVASATPKTVEVRVHGGYAVRRRRFTALKDDQPPVVPAANDIKDRITGRVTDRLVSANLTVNQPSPSTNGKYVWGLAGEYTYVTTRLDADGGPRIPGKSVFPAARFPFPIAPQDEKAAQITTSGPTSEEAYKAVQPTLDQIDGNTYDWPILVMPPVFFDTTLTIG